MACGILGGIGGLKIISFVIVLGSALNVDSPAHRVPQIRPSAVGFRRDQPCGGRAVAGRFDGRTQSPGLRNPVLFIFEFFFFLGGLLRFLGDGNVVLRRAYGPRVKHRHGVADMAERSAAYRRPMTVLVRCVVLLTRSSLRLPSSADAKVGYGIMPASGRPWKNHR